MLFVGLLGEGPALVRVVSPAPRVESHDSMAWLQTGVSSGNRPMFVTKMLKILLVLWRVST